MLPVILVVAALFLAQPMHAQTAAAGDGPAVSEPLAADSLAALRLCIWDRDEIDTAECPDQKDAYRKLIAHAGFADDPAIAEAMGADLHHLRLLVDADLQERLTAVIDEQQRDEELGEDVLRWWRSVNPMPATSVNERLRRHISRVDQSMDQYAYSDSPHGVDERGEKVIRFGPPTHTTSVNFTDTRLTAGVFRESPNLASSRFPQHEYWSYPHLGPYARYLFVKGPGGFEVGEVNDLVPSTARTGLGNTRRGHEKARHLRTLLQVIYGNLSVLNIEYGDMQQRIDDAYGPMALPGQSGPMMLINTYHRGRHEESQRDRIRDEIAPQQHAGRPTVAHLPLTARSARFRDDDGTTRTEVYWSVDDRAFEHHAEEEDSTFMITQISSQQRLDYSQWNSKRENVMVRYNKEKDSTMLEPQTFVAAGDTGKYHLVLQFDSYRARVGETDEFRSLGRHLNRNVIRLDSLEALPSGDADLLMSDIRPISISEDTPPAPGEAPPYPYEEIEPDTPLGLYFEIYNLSFGENEQTNYTVEYEIKRDERRGGIAGIFGGRRTVTTSSSTQHQGSSRISQEQVMLELEEWTDEGEIEVVVRVTDEVTGQEDERNLVFTMVDRE